MRLTPSQSAKTAGMTALAISAAMTMGAVDSHMGWLEWMRPAGVDLRMDHHGHHCGANMHGRRHGSHHQHRSGA